MRLHDVESLLPRTPRTSIAVIGLPATTALIQAKHGVEFPIPKRMTRQGEARFEELAESIGVEAAEKLCQHFGGERLEIPTCVQALRELSRRQLRSDFDQLTREHSARHAVECLAVKYRLTSRAIWRILKDPDKGTPVKAEQFALF